MRSPQANHNSRLTAYGSLLSVVLTVLLVTDSFAQERGWRATDAGVLATRAELTDLQSRLDAAAASTGYTRELRAMARAEGDEVRARLRDGDFRAGDRMFVVVERQLEMSDTFYVQTGPLVEMPVIGPISLRGVLRSELETHLATQIGQFVQQPVVRAQPLVRVSVVGGVGAPGYYAFPPETPAADMIMAVGGPGATAQLSKLEIERGNATLWKGKDLEREVQLGSTLADLAMREGDQIVVPSKPAISIGQVVAAIGVVSGLIYTIDRITGGRR